MTRKSTAPGRQPTYRSKLFAERVHDAYKASAKLPSPTKCPDCGAVFSDGRWTWLPAQADAHTERCPACQRVQDGLPAGYVKIEGEFPAGRRDEIVHLVRNLESKEKAEHPLQRVIDIADADGGVLVTTTDAHLAHGIGEALRRAYKGRLESRYNREENLLRVRWSR